MAKELRTEDGKAVWIVQREDEVEGQASGYKYIRPATEDDVEGQGSRYGFLTPEGTEDVEGQLGRYGYLTPEGTEDVEGQGGRRLWSIAPEPLDPEAGTYLAVIDEDDDVEGQGSRINY